MEYSITDKDIVMRGDKPVAQANPDLTLNEYIDDGKTYALQIGRFFGRERDKRAEALIPKTDKKKQIWDILPGCPKAESGLGDKDPVLCRWVYTNHRDVYDLYYLGRKTIIDSELIGKEENPTKMAMRAQMQGFSDANDRAGCDASRHSYLGVNKKEYEKGYVNGGGRI